MGHKPRVAVRDPFPGLSGARLARRRLLALAGHLIDDLIVVATERAGDRVAAARGRRHDVAVSSMRRDSPASTPRGWPRCGRRRRGAAGRRRRRCHGRPRVRSRDGRGDRSRSWPAVAHLDPRAELIWRPCAPRLPRHAPSAVAGVAGRPALVELAPAGWSIAPGASAWQLHAAGAAGVVAQPPRSPDAAAIWLDALLEGDRAGAILRALAGRCSTDARDLRRLARRRRRRAGRRLPLVRARRRQAARAPARGVEPGRRRGRAPRGPPPRPGARPGRVRALRHRPGRPLALEGDHGAAWDVYHAGLGEDDELGGAAGRLLLRHRLRRTGAA